MFTVHKVSQEGVLSCRENLGFDELDTHMHQVYGKHAMVCVEHDSTGQINLYTDNGAEYTLVARYKRAYECLYPNPLGTFKDGYFTCLGNTYDLRSLMSLIAMQDILKRSSVMDRRAGKAEYEKAVREFDAANLCF